MSTYKMHLIVMGAKIFDKGLMTYQYDCGVSYTCEAYDILLRVKGLADIILPLHEPEFAPVDTIG